MTTSQDPFTGEQPAEETATTVFSDTTEVTTDLAVIEDAHRLFPWWARGLIYVLGTLWAAGYGIVEAAEDVGTEWAAVNGVVAALVGIVAAANLSRR
jgi:predicted anti-sigma-YlaC factor YlaD